MMSIKPEGSLDTRFWKEDLRAGLLLSFIAVAFGLGIAQISHFPPEAGLISAIVAPLVIGFYRGSYLIICGSAAALAPILAAAVTTLGQGDDMLGYQRTLTVILFSGVFMYALGHLKKAGIFAALFSHAVTAGLLAAVAVILLTSRLSMFTGVDFEGHTLLAVLGEAFIQGKILQSDPRVLTVTVIMFGFLLGISLFKNRFEKFFQAFPPQLWALGLLFVLAYFIPLESKDRIAIPADLTAFHLWPAFNFADMGSDILIAFVMAVITLSVVDTAESVATVKAIDRLDTYKRTSDVDKVVAGMGIANILSAFLGGMSNIPGGAKSTMSAAVGTVTMWAGIYSALFVAVFVLLFREQMNLMSKAGLAAIIVFTVFKMCSPRVWKDFWSIGRDQFAVFFVTFAVSVGTGDILYGLIGGVVSQMLIVTLLSMRAANQTPEKDFSKVLRLVWELWTNPKELAIIRRDDGSCDVYFNGAWTFVHSGSLERQLESLPHDGIIRFNLGNQTTMVDHPALECIHKYVEGKGSVLNICSTLTQLSDHSHSTVIRSQSAQPVMAD